MRKSKKSGETLPGLELQDRSGLPDALRVLLEKYPRETWQQNSRFEGLVRFWLERHLMFRRLLEILTEDNTGALDRTMEPDQYKARLARYGGIFVNELHTHHHIEDHQYFPSLQRLDARLERGFDLLDSDHHELDAHLNVFTGTANAVLTEPDSSGVLDSAGRFHEVMRETSRFLDRHLTDEEELIVPVILEHGTGNLV